MMITLRKLPWRLPSQQALCLFRQWQWISMVMLVPVSAGRVVAANNNVSRQPVLKVNTVLATNVKRTRNLNWAGSLERGR